VKFNILDDINLEPYIDKTLFKACEVIGWDCEFIDQYIKFNYSIPLRATTQKQYHIKNPFTNSTGTLNIFFQDIRQLNFTPQIQALDMPVIIRQDKIRVNSLDPVLLVLKSTGWRYIKSIPAYVLIMALANLYLVDKDKSFLYKLNIIDRIPSKYKQEDTVRTASLEELIDLLVDHIKDKYPDILESIENNILNPLKDHIERGEKVKEALNSDDDEVVLTRSMLRENYDRDVFTWLGKYITRRNETKIGRRHVAEITYGVLLDIFNHPYYDSTNLLDLLLLSIWKHSTNQLIPDNDWNYKRFRVREYLLYPILEQILKCTSRLRKTINLKLTKYWYDSRLFVYNSVVNPLGYGSLRSRCTIKGPGALKFPNKDHRSVHESMKHVVDPISTGEREQAGIIHMVLDTEIDELTVFDEKGDNE